MKLYTSSWRCLAEASQIGPLPVQPVRTSNGLPKFWPQASSFPVCDELIPPKWVAFGGRDKATSKRGYRRQLHCIGVERIAARLDEIAAEYDGRPLALACFEADPADCHRSWAAEWLWEQTGIPVPELSLLRGRDTAALVVELNGAKTPAAPSGHVREGAACPTR